MRTNRFLACVVALALGAWGCDDNPETDAGLPRDAGGGTDAGTDAATPDEDGGGMTDAGSDAGGGMDAGPPMNFEIRLVNNIPGLTGSTAVPGGFHVCTYIANNVSGAVVAGTAVFRTETVGPVPFRGVSPYLSFPSVAPFNYLVALYDPPNLGDPAACPADPNAAGAATAALIATVEPDDVPVDSRVSAIATGLLPDTFGATGGALPAVCNAPAAAPTFMETCTTGTQLLTVIDDQTAPASGMTRVRVSNQVANSTPPAAFVVCYDPGLVPNPSGDGSCIDGSPMMTDEVAISSAPVPYGTVTDYADMSPRVPTGVPAAGVGGGLFIALGATCPDFSASGSNRCYPMLAALPPMTPPLPDNIRPDLADGAINTIFISGLAQLGPRDTTMRNGLSFFIWQDNYVAP